VGCPVFAVAAAKGFNFSSSEEGRREGSMVGHPTFAVAAGWPVFLHRTSTPLLRVEI